MTQQLSDKEKQALRLLLAGHDAKSCARELGVSVHTINDRLRNSRRKLGVSSSREAARILGGAEAETPQNPAHGEIGVGEAASIFQIADLDNTKPRGAGRAMWLAGGALIMSIALAVAFFFANPNAQGVAQAEASGPAQDAQTQASEQAENPASLPRAEAFLTFVDAGDPAGSREVAGPFFQSKVTSQQWRTIMTSVREPLGAAQQRSLVSVQRATTLPGAPEGEYELLLFETRFENGTAPMVETLVMMKGKDGWEMTGYFIR